MTLQACRVIGICAGLLITSTSAFAADGDIKLRDDRSILGTAVFNTPDFDRARAYYDLLGFQEVDHRDDKPHRLVAFNVGASHGWFTGGIALIETTEPFTLGNGSAWTIIVVKDVRAICKRLADAKTPCTREPTVPPGHDNALIGMATDPDGRTLELVQLP